MSHHEQARSPLEIVQSYFTALNTEDWELMASVLDPAIDLVPSGSRPRTGSDKAIAMFQKIFERFPVHQDNPNRFICDDSTVVVEITFNGATADGRELSFDAVDIFDVEDGRIRRLSQWFDTAALAAVLQA
ncbi:nuclear transport factor 2 family protein [Candidatus Poriferisocius sp.]|uniref:nuclear transport factor 2 family protein n=1 Tax=Candidatus Poriferisocius sp. TaxID=3101276 RepID=UPI003B026D03